ncbi:MAG: hypothetical protein RLZZ241_2077 [Bacteroidota bacterium]|jgi:outer membrane protein OmpA-like peptidoglycan-associated protein
MKRKLIPTWGFCMLFLFLMPNLQGQLIKNLAKSAKRAAERTVENRVNREASKKTDQVLDSILEPGKGQNPNNRNSSPNSSSLGGSNTENRDNPMGGSGTTASSATQLEIYSKFDFVRGDETLFSDDFEEDFIGDFPAKWDTDGNGEVVSVGTSGEKWFELKAGSVYIPNFESLPEDYTLEFDILALGLDNGTSSTSRLGITLNDSRTFNARGGENLAQISIPYCQFIAIGLDVKNKIAGDWVISNSINTDLRKTVLETHHIAIGVNGQRLRMWINETKHIDIPRMVAPGAVLSHMLLEVNGLRDGQDRIFIKNLVLAKGGVDLRRKLLSEGSVSTNGILFDSGSANLQPQSMGIIRQIYQVLEQDKTLKLRIVGHTDADGDEGANQRLSEARAGAVRDALVSVYNIDSNRLVVQGMGESQPVSENNTASGKAKNRRVVFERITTL